ncbi:hypothetical protein [Virgibacillus sediminis]|uniref:Phr family secreted Rap phosphatase inhibitor n=1 Tax=Virgibacillus sediminis TaxID=202260 RepID=A0ABV7A7Z5_9BACI
MRKVLLALFILIIVGVGLTGYAESNDKPVEVIDDHNHSTTITY